MRDCGLEGELNGQSLNLTAKEKLSEEDVQTYKYWCFERQEEDNFESLVRWLEMRVQIMDEAREETGKYGNRRTNRPEEQRRFKEVFNTTRKGKKCIVCIVDSCTEDHPPWVCKAFKGLSVQRKKELIAQTGRCFRCLAAGHQNRDCHNARQCRVDGCISNRHSRYLHEHDPTRRQEYDQTSQLRPEAQPFSQSQQRSIRLESGSGSHRETSHAPFMETGSQPRAKTHTTHHGKHVSFIIKVNIMLDPCSTGSYVSEAAAEELNLRGQPQTLRIAGTGGAEVTKRSSRVELTVSNIETDFSAKLETNVLDNITSDTPAVQWSELKNKWPHLSLIPFQQVAKRLQIDVLIGSDHPLFHRVLQEICGNKPDDPVARLTTLGWVCFGPTLVEDYRRKPKSHFTHTYRTSHIRNGESIDDLLRSFWELESMGITEPKIQAFTPEEKLAFDHARKTRQKTV